MLCAKVVKNEPICTNKNVYLLTIFVLLVDFVLKKDFLLTICMQNEPNLNDKMSKRKTCCLPPDSSRVPIQ